MAERTHILTEHEVQDMNKYFNIDETIGILTVLNELKKGNSIETVMKEIYDFNGDSNKDIDEEDVNYILKNCRLTRENCNDLNEIDKQFDYILNNNVPDIDKDLLRNANYELTEDALEKIENEVNKNHEDHNLTKEGYLELINSSDLSQISTETFVSMGDVLREVYFENSHANIDMKKINKELEEKEGYNHFESIHGSIKGCNLISFDPIEYMPRHRRELGISYGPYKRLEDLFDESQLKTVAKGIAEYNEKGIAYKRKSYAFDIKNIDELINYADNEEEKRDIFEIIFETASFIDEQEESKKTIINLISNDEKIRNIAMELYENRIDNVKKGMAKIEFIDAEFASSFGIDGLLKITNDEILKNNKQEIPDRREIIILLRNELIHQISISQNPEQELKKAQEYFTKNFYNDEDKARFNKLLELGIVNNENLDKYLKDVNLYPEENLKVAEELQKKGILNNEKNDIGFCIISATNPIGISNTELIEDSKNVGLDLVTRIYTSNSELIRGYANELFSSVVELPKEEATRKVEQAERIFSDNLTPDFIKCYEYFDLANRENQRKNLADVASEVIKTSQTFKDVNNLEINKKIILSDLFFSAANSNNKSLREFINVMQIGNNIYNEQIKSNFKKELTSEEDEMLEKYNKTVAMLYSINNTSKRLELTGNTKQDSIIIGKAYGQNGQTYNLNDIAWKTMIGPLQGLYGGLTTIDSVKKYMDDRQKESNERKEKEANETSEFRLQKGDAVKGLLNSFNPSTLKSFLHNGSIAKDFLETKADQDTTPFDTDISVILEDTKGKNIKESMRGTPTGDGTYNFNGFYLVMKDVASKVETTRGEDNSSIDNEENKDYNYLKGISNSDKNQIKEGINRRTNNSYERKYEMFHDGGSGNDSSAAKSHYGIRTAIGSEDFDAILVPEANKKDIDNLTHEMAIAGVYIPVYNMEGKSLFTPEKYQEYRKQMQGMKYYGADDFEVNKNGYNEEVENIIQQLFPDGNVNHAVNQIEADEKRKAILKEINSTTKELGLDVKNKVTGDLRSGFVELIDTGSTGRGTNIPGDSDFDFMLKIDKNIKENKDNYDNLKRKISSSFDKKDDSRSIELADGIRYKDVEIPNQKEKLDIDITYEEKNEKVEYTTDMAVKERLDNIKQTDPEGYKMTIANIILAKKTLKENGIYKKIKSNGHTEYGGLGGIGVENWILQNGGSFYQAISTFLAKAEECRNADGTLDVNKFRDEYPIFDYGENQRIKNVSKEPMHDHFISGFSDLGLHKAPEILKNIQQKLKPIPYKTQSECYKDAVEETIKDMRISEIAEAEQMLRNEKQPTKNKDDHII